MRAAIGGRLRIALSGGAAISRDTQEFLTTALELQIKLIQECSHSEGGMEVLDVMFCSTDMTGSCRYTTNDFCSCGPTSSIYLLQFNVEYFLELNSSVVVDN